MAIKNVDKTTIAKVVKVLSTVDVRSKYNRIIRNADIDTVENLGKIGIKKYCKCISQIQDKID